VTNPISVAVNITLSFLFAALAIKSRVTKALAVLTHAPLITVVGTGQRQLLSTSITSKPWIAKAFAHDT
jgi:hypothetical protein